MAALYEMGPQGLNIIGYNQGIRFYTPDRALMAEIYLRPDNTLSAGVPSPYAPPAAPTPPPAPPPGPPELAGWVLTSESFSKNNAVLHSYGYLKLGAGNNIIQLSAADEEYRLWAGHAAPEEAPFKVEIDGSIHAVAGWIGGWQISDPSITSEDEGIILNPSVPSISIGDASGYMEGVGIWMGEHGEEEDEAYKIHIGDPDDEHLYWDGEKLHITGEFQGTFVVEVLDILATNKNTFTINAEELEDVDTHLILAHADGASAYLSHDGDKFYMSKKLHIGGELEIGGDLDLGNANRQISAGLDIDLVPGEGYRVRAYGDVVAHVVYSATEPETTRQGMIWVDTS